MAPVRPKLYHFLGHGVKSGKERTVASRYIRKTARYNGKKYEATGKPELEAMTKLAEKLAAAKRGEELISNSMSVDTWYKQ